MIDDEMSKDVTQQSKTRGEAVDAMQQSTIPGEAAVVAAAGSVSGQIRGSGGGVEIGGCNARGAVSAHDKR